MGKKELRGSNFKMRCGYNLAENLHIGGDERNRKRREISLG